MKNSVAIMSLIYLHSRNYAAQVYSLSTRVEGTHIALCAILAQINLEVSLFIAHAISLARVRMLIILNLQSDMRP